MALDEADLKKISDLIGAALKPETIGAAVKSHVDSLKLGDLVTGEVKKAMDALPKAEPKADEKGKSGDKGRPDDDTAQRLKAMEDRLKERDRQLTESESKRRADAADGAVRDALVASGVPADRVPLVLPYLRSQGLIVDDNNGAPGWKGKDQYGVDAVLAPKDGVAAFLKTDAGKNFLPPRNAQGTGDGAGSVPIPRTPDGKVDMSALKDRMASAAFKAASEG